MDKIRTPQGDVVVRDGRFAIVAARFNDFIVESLIKGAVHCLRQHGADDGNIEIIRVPGAFEMPLAVDKVAATRRFDGIVFGILTVDTIEQAIERAGTKAGNKGEEATLAVIEMVNLLRRID
jgi:6,7-dimethyl-8-ribityllumazine synthase